MDGSINSLDETLFRSKRELVFEVTPMTKEMIWKLDQLQDLFRLIEESGLADTVFAVLGGYPAAYVRLRDETKLPQLSGEDPRSVIGSCLCKHVEGARKLVMGHPYHKFIPLFDKERNCIPRQLLEANNLKRPSPDKVFREVIQEDDWALIPASNAIGLVLRHGLRKAPTLTELEEMILNK